MDLPLRKGDLMYSGEGYQLFATNDENLVIMEWENEYACRLAFCLHTMLKRHALGTNFVERHGHKSLVVQKLEPIGLTVVSRTTHNDSSVRFVDSHGQEMDKEEATSVPGAKLTRLEMMEDVALHSVRSLRAYIMNDGVEEMELRLTFGIASSGECQLQAINPVECQLGSTDFEALCNQLGGDSE